MKLDRIVLVEGYMDVIGATQAGVTEAVATCGTALTVDQIRAMKRLSLNLHLNFDPDSAGANAAERSIRLLLDENVRVRIVELEGGLDPDEYAREHGAEAYRKKVAAAKTYFYWLADRARARFNTREPQGRVDAFQFLLPSIQSLNDKLERAVVAKDLASYLGVEEGLVLEHFRKAAADRAVRPPAPVFEPPAATDRILLPLLVTDSEARLRLIESLRDLPALRRLTTAPIYEALIALHDAGEPVDFHSVHSRLPASLQERFAAIVLDAPVTSAADGEACIDTLRHGERQARQKDLKARIRDAERAGRIAEALDLTRQLMAMG